MERRKRLFSHEVKRTRLEMQEFMCGNCGQDLWKKPSGYTQGHHIVPHSLGGTLEPENLVILCPSCHVEADNAVMLHGTIYGGYHISEADNSQRSQRR
jgi:5-methylcytosine-specific restriction endonuclease McrA